MKQNFLSVMLAAIASMFTSNSEYKNYTEKQFQPEAPPYSGKNEITSYGKRTVYPSVKRDPVRIEKHQRLLQELALRGIGWHDNKLYWMTHQLAEEHRILNPVKKKKSRKLRKLNKQFC